MPDIVGCIRLPAAIARADVAVLTAAGRRQVAGAATGVTGPVEPVACDAAALVDPGLPAVDVVARLTRALRRDGRRIRLEHAGPALLDLLRLCGLLEAVGVTESDVGVEPERPPA